MKEEEVSEAFACEWTKLVTKVNMGNLGSIKQQQTMNVGKSSPLSLRSLTWWGILSVAIFRNGYFFVLTAGYFLLTVGLCCLRKIGLVFATYG